MKFDGRFQIFFTSFIVGVANLCFFSLYFVLVTAHTRGLDPAEVVEGFLKRAEPFILLFGTLGTVAAILLGQALDALGHLTVDKYLKREKAKLFLEERQRTLAAEICSIEGFDKIKPEDAVLGIFYAQVPEHILHFYEGDWDFYEIYRNIWIAAVAQFLAGVSLMIWMPRVGVIVVLVAGLFIGLLWPILRFGIRHHNSIQILFVLGWLYSKRLEDHKVSDLAGGVRAKSRRTPLLKRTPDGAA